MLKKLFNKDAVNKTDNVSANNETTSEVEKRERIRKKFEASRNIVKEQEKKDIEAAKEFFLSKNNINARIADQVRECLRSKRVKFLYQPMFDINQEQPVFYEVFTHLVDKDGRTTEPGKYIPIANKFGLSSWLDEVVFSKLLETQKNENTQFAINLTGETLRRSMDFFEQLMNSIMETGFPPSKLLFEIKFNEIDKDGNTLDFIKEAREMQFRFVLDYIGGGTKVIKMIQSLGFSYIKIDALRFSNFATNERLANDLKDIVKTAKESNMLLIMERVETREMYNFCKEIGFDYVQGYYLSMPSEKLETRAKYR